MRQMRWADVPADVNQITGQVLDAAIRVHRELGPGMLERVYALALSEELTLRSIPFQTEVQVPVSYRGRPLGAHLRADFIVADKVLIEVKAVEAMLPVHEAQVLSYLRFTGCPVGLLLNFHAPRLLDGFRRLTFHPSAAPRLRGARSER